MRRAGAASVLALVGCMGTNPAWDKPDGSVVTGGETSTTSESSADSRGAATTVPTSASASDPGSGDSDDAPAASVEGTAGEGSTNETSGATSSPVGGETSTTTAPSDGGADEDGADGVTGEPSPPSDSGDDPPPADDGADDDPPPPPCAANEQLCEGVCREIDHDKHWCGPDCIDCTDLYGNHAKCEDGECEPHDHGDGGEGKGG